MGKISMGSKIIYEDGGGGGSTTFTDLTDTPIDYINQGGKTLTVKADESGVDFQVASSGGVAENGLPVGGVAGQVLAKVDDTNFNANWVDGGGGKSDYLAIFDFGGTKSTNTTNGVCVLFKTTAGVPIAGGSFYTNWEEGVVFIAKLWDANKNLLVSKSFVGDGILGRKSILFDYPYTLTPLSNYYISIEHPTNIEKYYGSKFELTTFVTHLSTYTGTPDGTLNEYTNAGYCIGVILKI